MTRSEDHSAAPDSGRRHFFSHSRPETPARPASGSNTDGLSNTNTHLRYRRELSALLAKGPFSIRKEGCWASLFAGLVSVHLAEFQQIDNSSLSQGSLKSSPLFFSYFNSERSEDVKRCRRYMRGSP